MLKVSVVVLAQGVDNNPVLEETRTVTVNAHGAMILLSSKVSIGQLLTFVIREPERKCCAAWPISAPINQRREK
jgi:hypothetical protein